MFLLLFLVTVFFHIWDDFGRQGIMASMKQKSWWEKQEGYNKFYRYDWIPALLAHSISWSVMISIPSIVYAYILTKNISYYLLSFVFIQAAFHFMIDNAKCNDFKINLCVDQLLHVVQIIAEIAVCYMSVL